MKSDLIIKNGTVVTPEFGPLEADIGINDGKISHISKQQTLDGVEEIDADGKYVLPGVIDPHTHHGTTYDLADDAETESRSGLVGGVTTIGNYIRNVEKYTEVLDDYFNACEPNYYHDYFISPIILTKEHVDELPQLVNDFGITSFKWHRRYKQVNLEKFGGTQNIGIEEDTLDDVPDRMIRYLSNIDVPTTLGCHSENREITRGVEKEVKQANKQGYEALVEAFPGYTEAQSMVSGASLAKAHDYDNNFYAVHISSAQTANDLADLHKIGYGVIGETCTHYLTLTSDQCDSRMKVNPPIRSEHDKETLWERVADGTINCIGTDHCMKPLDGKSGEDIWEVVRAFPSTATMLPLILSEGVVKNRISLKRAVEITSTNNAKAWNLYPKKGTLRVGSDADITIVDLDETKTVTPDLLKSAAEYSIYEGMEISGWPTHTIVRGELAFENGNIVGTPGYGTHIDRPI